MNIPAGYQLHLTTWENDADAYKTQISSGLSYEDVNFYLEIAKHFESRNSHHKGLGNGPITPEKLVSIVREAHAKHPDISAATRELWFGDIHDGDDEVDQFSEALYNYILGSPVEYDDYLFCRVFEKFQVFFYPVEIKEVTLSFALSK